MLSDGHRALFVLLIILPFLAQGIPYPGGIPLFLPVAALLIPATVFLRIAEKGVSGLVLSDGPFMAICVVVLLTHLYGIILSTDFPGQELLRDIFTGVVAMAIVFTAGNSAWSRTTRDRLVVTLAWTLLTIGAFVGLVGAYKFWLFVSQGQTINYVLTASSKGYPWGTSLVTDYNFYALTILVAILSGLYLCDGRPAKIQIMLALTVAVLIIVGFLAGSRRFWVIAPLIILAQLGWMVLRGGVRRYLPLLLAFLTFLVSAPIAIVAASDQGLVDLITTGWNLQYRLGTLLDSTAAFGLRDSRFELWYAAADRLTGLTPWVGDGFDYMRWFSCEYGNCSGDGYPHMPILSAYLYGGVLAGGMVIVLYLYMTIAGIRLMSHRGATAWLIFPMMAAFLFAAISANGPFSIRAHVVLGALCVGFSYADRVDAAKIRTDRSSLA
jgi:hypothetical protein